MTVYEIIMVVLGALGLLVSMGMLLITWLNFLEKRKKKRK